MKLQIYFSLGFLDCSFLLVLLIYQILLVFFCKSLVKLRFDLLGDGHDLKQLLLIASLDVFRHLFDLRMFYNFFDEERQKSHVEYVGAAKIAFGKVNFGLSVNFITTPVISKTIEQLV